MVRTTGDQAGVTVVDDVRCGPRCGDPVVITTRGGDGCEVTLRSCGSCGLRSWSRDGRPAPLRELLEGLGGPPMGLLRAS